MEASTLTPTRQAPPRPHERHVARPRPRRRPPPPRDRGRTPLLLALILLAALGLRLWGIRWGLPFSYNEDEDGHFVPIAISFLGHGLDPGYFLNPPGFTELLAAIYGVWFGGRAAAEHAYAQHPGEVLLIARVSVAVLGTLAVWLLHAVGARLFDRRVGLLAAALGACAFLPVAYGHLALNDVPALGAATLALLGAALVLRGGGTGAALLGGLAAGLAAGTKYTAGIVLLPLLAAVALRALGGRRGRDPMSGARRIGFALAAAAGGFLIANPYALLHFGAFHAGVSQQQELTSGDELAKLGLTHANGIRFYLWTFTWGLGWVPALAAVGGALRLLVHDRRLALVLLPAPILFIAFMGSQERYFGRWLLPIFPIVIVLAASFGVALARWLARRAPGIARPAAAAVVLALLGQGLVTTIHADGVLARADTRTSVRTWMRDHIPAGTRVVVEPIVPDAWSRAPDGTPLWRLWNVERADVDDIGRPLPAGETRFVKTDKYERVLRPALLDQYVAQGFCWVVTGSTQRGRAFAQPAQAPRAIAYYRALERRGQAVLHVSPYRAGATPPAFDFDWSFDAYPLAYARPGPDVVVYRLRGGACG
jgi:dolichyl-phosphate-mannose-protein mannosyltransferase